MAYNSVLEMARELQEELVDIRRQLHSYPELGSEMNQTIQYVRAKLEEFGVHYQYSHKIGIIACIEGENTGGCVLLRADMDALPIQEETQIAYRSKLDKRMHACGHDAHTAWLLGAAAILQEHRERIYGSVKVVFQLCEEGKGIGIREMIEGGVLQNPEVDIAIASHVSPTIPIGKYSISSGGVTTTPASFRIQVKGKGGHAAEPFGCIDPILILNQIYNEISSIQRILLSPKQKAVISITKIHSGETQNVIPEMGEMSGTIRTFSREDAELLLKKIEKIAYGIGEIHGAEVEVHYEIPIGSVINNPIVTQYVKQSAQKLLGEEALMEEEFLFMGGDDFSSFSENVPSCYFFTGVGNKEKDCIYPIHNCKFNLDEDCLYQTVAILAQVSIDYLEDKKRRGK